MNASPAPEGPGSVSGAPYLPDGFTGTFTSRYLDTAGLRQHVVIGGKTRRLTLPVLGIGGAHSLSEQVADTMELAADDVQTLVIPGCGHHPPKRPQRRR
jgi:pimeloyl-ACP methyl ester carboxylesterase